MKSNQHCKVQAWLVYGIELVYVDPCISLGQPVVEDPLKVNGTL